MNNNFAPNEQTGSDTGKQYKSDISVSPVEVKNDQEYVRNGLWETEKPVGGQTQRLDKIFKKPVSNGLWENEKDEINRDN